MEQEKQNQKQCFLFVLISIGVFVVIAGILGSLLRWQSVPYGFRRQLDAMNFASYFIGINWESWSGKSIGEREELILKETQIFESDINLYRAEIDGSYMIIIVPKEFHDDDIFRPRVYLSKGDFATIERIRVELLERGEE